MNTNAVFIFTLCALLASCGEPNTADTSVEPVPAKAAPDTLAAAPDAPDGELVTPDNFCRAETDNYFADLVKANGFGKLGHERALVAIDKQTVVRMNRDTYYSFGVFDLDAGSVTITLPDPGKRYMALMPVDEDHYVPGVAYAPGKQTYTREKMGTRYFGVAIRTFGDPNDPKDVAEVHRLQDAITVEQPGGPGTLELPKWDTASRMKVRGALAELAPTLTNFTRSFGTKAEVDSVRHLIGTAVGWGGNPDAAAAYASITPKQNDGRTNYTLHVKDVPVDGFWSISVYNEKGFFEPNAENAYSLNNVTAKKNADGSFDIRFGECDGKTPNCLPISAGWNYTVRMYRPQKELVEGKWKFPEAQLVD